MYKIVAGLAFVVSVMTVAGLYVLSLGLGVQVAVLVIGMGWVTVLLLVLGLLGRTSDHHSTLPSNAKSRRARR